MLLKLGEILSSALRSSILIWNESSKSDAIRILSAIDRLCDQNRRKANDYTVFAN